MQQVLNFYTELPEVPYQKTAVPEDDVISYIHSLDYTAEVKRTVFAVSYNETAGYKALVNTNAAGFQGDNSRWAQRWDNIITATTVKRENMTGNARRFLVFKSWQSSINMLAYYMRTRGIYVGGNAQSFAGINPVRPARAIGQPGEQNKTAEVLPQADLYTAYLRAWVLGDALARPRLKDMKDFTLLYNKAEKIFAA